MKTALAAALAAALASPFALASDEPVVVLRQHLAAADAARDQADMWKRWADDYSREMRTSMGAMFAGRTLGSKVVKGAPYSAEVVTESNQALADGNVISRRTTGAVYRDGEGRVRQETAADGKERTVFINDPVAGTHTVLTPGAKRAITTASRAEAGPGHRERRVVRVNGTEIRVEDGQVTIDGKPQPPGATEAVTASGKRVRVENGRISIDGKEIDAGPGSNVVVKRIEHGEGDGTRREEVRVQVIHAGDGDFPAPPVPPVPPVPLGPEMKGKAMPVPPVPPVPPLPPMPGVSVMRFENPARYGKPVATPLGQREFDGVRAEGRQLTWTIPAGQIGNRNPIQVVSETWYSPDLQVTVYSRYNDPRTGESVYRLSAIKRAEPAADLFKVPEDYKAKVKTR